MAADKNHDSTKTGESPIGPEHRPGSGDERLTFAPEADLSEDEKSGEKEDESVDHVGEELEAVGEFGKDEHEHRCHHHGQQDSDIAETNDLQNDVGMALETRVVLSKHGEKFRYV